MGLFSTTFHYLIMLTEDQPNSVLINKANCIKKAGVKCTDLTSSDVIETATNKVVGTMYELIFEGNPFQIRKAVKIADRINPYK